MPAKTYIDENKTWYLDAFQEFEQSLNGQRQAPVHALRQDAIGHFGSLGFPTPKNESWNYTNLARLNRTNWRPAPVPTTAPTLTQLEPLLAKELDGVRLVFVNGHFAPDLSAMDQLPAGVLATDLPGALQDHPELVEPHLGTYASSQQHSLVALNTAFLQDGAFIHIPSGTIVERPLHLLFVSTGGAEPTVSFPRVLVDAQAGSRAAIVTTYAGFTETAYHTNAVDEINLGEDAELDFYKIQLEGPQAYHLSSLHVQEGAKARFRAHTVTLGGLLTRNDAHTVLAGTGIESTLNGLYVVDDEQHVDNHTLIEHAAPGCTSHELYKGILGGRATGAFRGKIHVHQVAQQTDAYQSNQNLLLSPDADINTQPQLEIYADEVKCSHGATVGQLDPEAIFYMQARGIGQQQAMALLIGAFAGQILSGIALEPLRAQLDRLVTAKLATASPA
ncbi:MAG: Fe-S cluster assembly protein SufD [Candidatus Latescibacteria bacterium]|nr:Fe-S cluster assembly protein SufD [Candidatus Latescibacterota bacterium]